MFIRKNKNRSGSISIQVIEKYGRKNKVIKSLGAAKDPSKIEILIKEAELFIERKKGLIPLFTSQEDALIQAFVNTISNDDLRIVGPKLVLEKIYHQIGYKDVTEEELFMHLVICRIVSPGSKLQTVQYMLRHYRQSLSEQAVYRYLDRVEDKLKPTIEQITYEHSKKVLGGSTGIVFYDMSTLYFETESEDDLRVIGYSKDGKHQHPQIMIGLLVGAGGVPIGYDVYKGNTAETKTLIPFLEKMVEKFKVDRPTIVADSALLSKKNIEALIANKYGFILGGRIKNESFNLKESILSADITEEQPIDLEHLYGRLIVSYSNKRAQKDLFNRKRGLRRIEAKVKTGKLTKQAINNRGYNKYLHLEGDTKVAVNYEAFEADSRWDGLKGYITNTTLKSNDVVQHYSNLWQIEKAFRMSKSDLRFRPIYHRKESRIKAHIAICFAAYAVYKELERQIKTHNLKFSVETAVKNLKEIQELTYTLPMSKKRQTKILSPNNTQTTLLEIFDI
jgi:transposase